MIDLNWISISTAVGGGLGTGLGIAVWLVKRELSRVMAASDRVPEKVWFERVEEKIDRLDPDRVGEHDRKVHEHDGRLVDHGTRLVQVERRVEDHEVRIRAVEVK